jgi:DNA-3-methyladenine glycosylase I
MSRCAWAESDPLCIAYHDQEWGVPVHDDRLLFEFLVLEGAQAGLSWLTILKKREGYRKAFAGFDPVEIAAFGPDDVERCWPTLASLGTGSKWNPPSPTRRR